MKVNARFYIILILGLLMMAYLWVFPVLIGLNIISRGMLGEYPIVMLFLPPILSLIWIVVSAVNIIDKNLSRNINKRQTIFIALLEFAMLISPMIILAYF